MLVAAAVCPHPPLIVPQIAAGAAPDLDELRSACDEAIRRVLAADVEALLVIGAAPTTRSYPPDAAGTLGGYGVDLGVGHGTPMLPLSLTVGRWLLDRVGADVALRPHGVTDTLPSAECADIGWRLSGGAHRFGMLCMGDGSARRSAGAPGGFDPRASAYDAAVAAALGGGDPPALLAIDPDESTTLLAAGRASWQVLAGAAGGGRWTAQLHYDAAPYGVGYFVASWLRA